MDIEKLKILVQIADSGSIHGAARQLGATRSSLRRALEGLEAEVGAALFHRDASGARLTAAGFVLVEQGRPMVERARAMLDDARAAASAATGILRVIEPVGSPLGVRVRGLMAMRLALPRQRIEVRQVEDPLTSVHEPFDLMLHEGVPPDRSTWFSRVVLRVPLRLLASRDYLARRGTPGDVAALPAHDTVGWRRPGRRAGEWPLLAGGAVEIAPWVSSADPMMLRAVVTSGGGIMLGPRPSFFDEPTDEGLTTLLEDEVGEDLVFRVTAPYPTHADSRTRDTMRLILAQLENLPND